MSRESSIKDVMTEGVIAIEKDKSVQKAASLLKEEGIRGLVVLQAGEAVGVVVCRDIVYEVVEDGLNPQETHVGEFMSEDLIVAEEDELLGDVAMAMIRNNVSRIPVVREDIVVGIVTQSDIIRAWPGFAEALDEQEELETEFTPRNETKSGVCEDCENYSEDLETVNGLQLCPECRSTRDMA